MSVGKTDYTFEIDKDFLSEIIESSKEDMKIKDFWDIVNLQGSLEREVYLGDINTGSGTSVESQIRFWNDWDNNHNIPIEDRVPIKLYVDSYGGDLLETFCMMDAIKMSKTPVWTICRSTAYSGGFFTFICGHRRIAYPHASFLFHEGATSNGGTASQFENYSKFYRVQLNQLKDLVLANTNFDEDWYKEHQKEDVWFTAQEGMTAGWIDAIAEEFV